jgi:hypothetical protein
VRYSITQPLARHKEISGPFVTEPFECAWASEAIFFIRVQETSNEEAKLTARPQISADGIHWVDEGSSFSSMQGVGVWFLRLQHFGGWLRLCCDTDGSDAQFTCMVHLVLKE